MAGLSLSTGPLAIISIINQERKEKRGKERKGMRKGQREKEKYSGGDVGIANIEDTDFGVVGCVSNFIGRVERPRQRERHI